MTVTRRSGMLIILLILLALTATTFAQDETATVDSVIIGGSGIVTPILQELTADTELAITYNVTGTSAGIQALCDGSAVGAAASRPMTIDEDATCITNSVEYVELLVAHNIITFIANPADTFLSCLSLPQINALFAPSATVNTSTWLDVNADYPETPVSVVIPADNTLTYATVDGLVDGDGLRADAATGSNEDIINAVQSSTGTVGVLPLVIALAAEPDVTVLDADFGDNELGCNFPSIENVEDRFYSGSDSLYLYLNVEAVETLDTLVQAVLNSDNRAVIEATGFSAPSDTAYAINQAIISGEEGNRTFTQDVVTFEIPPNLSGTVAIAGSPVISAFINTTVNNLTGQFTALTVDVNLRGESDGIRRFCNGEVTIGVLNTNLTQEQQSACEANNVVPTYFPLGTRAVILVANEADDFALCLTKEQIQTIWSAQSSDVVMNWQDVGASFPDLDMTLFGIQAGNASSDLLLTREDAAPLPIRTDTELNSDALYRAAATANVTGALTYMSWADYQRVLDNNQQNIQLVQVDGGNGCILPSEASITDGTYPLTQSAQFVVAESALTDVATQSVLWSMFANINYAALERTGLIGIRFNDLVDIRDNLQTAFALAAEEANASSE